jgi:hypothetical protein
MNNEKKIGINPAKLGLLPPGLRFLAVALARSLWIPSQYSILAYCGFDESQPSLFTIDAHLYA